MIESNGVVITTKSRQQIDNVVQENPIQRDYFTYMMEIANQRFQFLPGAIVFTRPRFQKSSCPFRHVLWKAGLKSNPVQFSNMQAQLGKWRNPQTYLDEVKYTPFSEEMDACIQILLADRRTS